MPASVSRDQVVAFRLAAHHLDTRLHCATGVPGPPAEADLVAAARTCAVQNSPPGSALLALHARCTGVTAARFDAAVAQSKSLVQTWSMRGAPYVFPTADAFVFTTGVLPQGEQQLRHFIPGVVPALDSLGLTISAAVELTEAALPAVLSGRRLAIGELGAELAARMAASLRATQRATWASQGPWAPGLSVGEGVVHFALRISTLRGTVCFAPRAGGKAPFVLMTQWVPDAVPWAVDAAAARAELLRRFLHAYGPSTPTHFATWLGVESRDTGAWWDAMAGDLAEVDYGGASWVLAEDLAAMRAARKPQGVRLLPPRDPYTQAPDHETLAQRHHHRAIWRATGEPGTVLVAGEIVGTWRPRKASRRLTLTVTPFAALPKGTVAHIEEEAEHIAHLRGATSARVEVA